MKERITVFVADDHPVYLEGLVRAIKARPELELVGEGTEGYKALEMIKELDPQVAILDVKMPGLNGDDILVAIGNKELKTRVILLSADFESQTLYRGLSEGAGAILSKRATRTEICDAAVAIQRGEVVLGTELQAGLATEIRLRESGGRPVLTPREMEILELTASGLSAPQMAAKLHLSTATIKTHLSSIYEKLGVSDRAAAVAEGMRHRLVH